MGLVVDAKWVKTPRACFTPKVFENSALMYPMTIKWGGSDPVNDKTPLETAWFFIVHLPMELKVSFRY
jgi:hypothetical protein